MAAESTKCPTIGELQNGYEGSTTANTITVNNSTKWNGKSLSVVSSLPSTKDSNTIYFKI